MGYKKLWVVILVLFVLPAYAFSAEPSVDFSSIHNIKNTIQTKTPEFIKKPLIGIINKLENFRLSVKLKIEQRRLKVDSEIKDKSDFRQEEKNILKEELAVGDNFQEYGQGLVELFNGFKYLEIFILTLILYVFSFKLIFYSGIALLIFIITHFFWYRIY